MTTHSTVWFVDKLLSMGVRNPVIPATSLGVNDGDLYLQVFEGKILYMWMRISKGGPWWKHVKEGVDHPTLTERVLHIRRDQKPSWVLCQSIQRYRRGCVSPMQFIDMDSILEKDCV